MNNNEERDARSRKRWRAIAIAMMFVAMPVGIGLFIAQALDLLPNIGGKVDINNMKVNIPDEWLKPKTPEKKTNKKGLPSGGGFIALGVILAIIGSALTISTLVNFGAPLLLLRLAGALSFVAAGTVFAVYGKLRKKKRQRFETYLKLIGDQQAVSIHALADAVGTDYKKTVKDLQEMITVGILNPAWLDMKNYRLMLTEFVAPTTAPEPEGKEEETLSRSQQILRQIRADNDLIADEEVSDKIDRIENLTRKIFEIVDRYPEKEKQLYSFLNYYLPTTLKSLESYARLEAQGIETDSIREAKQKINLMLDELASGYEKQLDKLFENDVIDISADIEVMRQMLQKDGLTEDEITRR